MDNQFEYVDNKPGTVFKCESPNGPYLAVYTGRWQPILNNVKLEVIKLTSKQNHDAERINASEVTGSIDRDKIFTSGDKVRVPFHTGTVQEFTEEFIIVAIKTVSTTKLHWPRLIGLNAEYARKAALST